MPSFEHRPVIDPFAADAASKERALADASAATISAAEVHHDANGHPDPTVGLPSGPPSGDAPASPTPKPVRAKPEHAKQARKVHATNKLASAATSSATSKSAPVANPTMAPAVAENLAKAQAVMLNFELTQARGSNDPNKKYQIIDILERTPDALTRQKLNEQFAANNGGKTIQQMIGSEPGLNDRDKKEALGLVSEERDQATNKLAAMDPKAREELEDKAAVWSDRILAVTRSADHDDSEHADQIADVLAGRTPDEIEVIRSRIRLQTSGTKRATAYEELDRSFTERDKGIALAGLHGSHAAVAAEQLADAAAEKDPARIHKVVKQLGVKGLAELRAMQPDLTKDVLAQMPGDQREHVQAALDGRTGEADGARIASMLQPVTLDAADALNVDKAKQAMSRKDAQDPERLIAEFGKMSPADLAEARKTHGAAWDKLIAEQFKDVDPTVRMRIEAAASGDRIGERALRLRQGMRTFNQDLIDQALANPDLQSNDPKKRAAAEAERSQLEARMRLHDENEQRTRAMMGGQGAGGTFAGRGIEAQLTEHYARAREHDTARPDASPFDAARNVVHRDERMAKIREKATADEFAAKEMLNEGDARASTKVRRAELAGNHAQKAEVLERLDSKTTEDSDNTLAAQSAEYEKKFRRNMLSAPDQSEAAAAVKNFGWLVGGEGSEEERAKQLTRENMSVGELKVEHVRESGVLADRSRQTRLAQQKELRDLSHSSYLEGDEQLRHAMGGNRGSEDLLNSQINVMEKGIVDGVSDREADRRDRSTSSGLDLQREEKQRAAAKVAESFSVLAKVAALATGNPWLFAAINAGLGTASVAAQEMIANEAYDATAGMMHVGADLASDVMTGGLGKLKGGRLLDMAGNIGIGQMTNSLHNNIDGTDDAGGSFWRNAAGVVLPGLARGKVEGLFKGTGRASAVARGVAGTGSDFLTNGVVNNGHLDGRSMFDAVTNTAQGHMHGGGHRANAAPHEYARASQHIANHDVASPRRSVNDDGLRRATPSRAEPRTAAIDEHLRERDAKRQAAAAQVHDYVVDHDGPSFASASPLHAGADTSLPKPRTDSGAVAAAGRRDDGPKRPSPERTTDDARGETRPNNGGASETSATNSRGGALFRQKVRANKHARDVAEGLVSVDELSQALENDGRVALPTVTEQVAFASVLAERGSRRGKAVMGTGKSEREVTFQQFKNPNSTLITNIGTSEQIMSELSAGKNRLGMTDRDLLIEMDRFRDLGEVDPKVRADKRLHEVIAADTFRRHSLETMRIPTNVPDEVNARNRIWHPDSTLADRTTPADAVQAVRAHRLADEILQREEEGAKPLRPGTKKEQAGRQILDAHEREARNLPQSVFDAPQALQELLESGVMDWFGKKNDR